MKKIFLFLLAFITVNISRAQNEIVIDPNASVRILSGNFNAIKISGGIDLYVSQSETEAVAVSAAEERYKDAIKITIENGVLKINAGGDKKWNLKDRKMRAYVSFKNLEKIDASGACDVVVSGTIAVNALDLVLSGASDFKGMVKTNSLKLNLSGASNVRISGTAGNVDIVSSGASDVDGYNLISDICNAKVSGASDINITVNKELNASASGASEIHFKGTGLIKDMHSSGSSSISRKS
ncbi:MAG TPA: head GIN domain-containing protein [Ferruginibacter sp.]|nr:head GIN domain-containing protein [Ferruginibacter sp.]